MYERTISSETVFTGRILSLELLEVELEDGSRSQREIIRHRGAAGVVCRLADGRFLFVRQFRKPIADYCLEVVAGLLEEGEAPADCARREVREETGYVVESLVELGSIALSPGYSSEYIHLFFARLAAQPTAPAPDDGEHVYPIIATETEFGEMVRSGEVADGKTLAAWLLFEKIREIREL